MSIKDNRSDIEKVLNNSNNENIKSIIDIIKKHDDFNPTLALVLVLDKLIENFEKKDIIPSNYGKIYALLSKTNKIQKDLISEIIAKNNDKKGQAKKMYYDIIIETLKSIKQNSNNENDNSFWSKFKLRK